MSKTRIQGSCPWFALLVTLPLLLGSNAAVAQSTTDAPEPVADATTAEEPAPTTSPVVAENTLEGCGDKVDNDGDGHVDCDDQDCQIYAMCVSPPEETKAKAPREHTGFFLRFLPGAGGGGFKVTGETERLNLVEDGRTQIDDFAAAGAFTFSLGGAVKENLILEGDLLALGISDGDGDSSDPDLAVYGIGFGVTYYFMPVNLYLTGSVGYAVSVLLDGYDEEEEDFGYGVYGMIVLGKEWMVSQNWGLGLAGQGIYSYGYSDNVHYNQGTFIVAFSATYN